MTYPHIYKCVEGVPETLEEMMGGGMYVSGTRAMVSVKSRATKKDSSLKCVGGGGSSPRTSVGVSNVGGDGDKETVSVRVVMTMKFKSYIKSWRNA